MRARTLVLALALAALPLTGCDVPTGSGAGGGLSIVRTNADPSATTVAPGASVTLSVETTSSSPSLLYSWSATGGSLSSATGNPVRWTAPASAGVYRVEVTVTDGANAAMAAYRFTVEVK